MVEHDEPPAALLRPSATAANEPSRAWECAARIARWFGLLISVLSVLFAIATYLGFWNYVRGDTSLSFLASRLDLSYTQVSRQVRPTDPEWQPLIRVITKYTRANLPRGRTPVVFARSQAVMSAELKNNGNVYGEWTAPTTPIMLLYQDVFRDPPNAKILPNDVIIVGTIGDLHDWIRRDENGFDFLVRTIIFGALSACIGCFLLASKV